MIGRRPPLGRLLDALLGPGAVRTADPAEEPGGHPLAAFDRALARKRRRYADLRGAVAGCLFVRAKLRGRARQSREAARVARDRAGAALAEGDVRASRRWVGRASTLLDGAARTEARVAALEAETAEAVEALRALGVEIAALEEERLHGLALYGRARLTGSRDGAASTHDELEEARRALACLEAERSLEAELDPGR